ncbi:hypothetical protein ACFSR7_27330 [Cohnella sp. GCM10020058]
MAEVAEVAGVAGNAKRTKPAGFVLFLQLAVSEVQDRKFAAQAYIQDK